VRSLHRSIGIALIVFENSIGNNVAKIAAQCNRMTFMPGKRRDSIFTFLVLLNSAWVIFSLDGKICHFITVVNIGIQ
jgi:hypothetical protein